MMWPFKKKSKSGVQTVSPFQVSFSQLDITERFDDHLRLQPDEWVETVPLNRSIPDGQAAELPPVDAGDDVTYRFAERLSEIRESIQVPTDGVYCPVCHRAGTDLSKLRTPCPNCGRPLLRFGWD
jgi:hypothetical protein